MMIHPDISAAVGRERTRAFLEKAEAVRRAKEARGRQQPGRASSGTRTTPLRRLWRWLPGRSRRAAGGPLRPAPGMGGILGACHGLDIPLVFGNLDRGQPAVLIGDGPSLEAEAQSARMRAAWTR